MTVCIFVLGAFLSFVDAEEDTGVILNEYDVEMFREKAFNCFSVTMVKEFDSCVLSAANSVLLVVGCYMRVVCYGVCVQCCMHVVCYRVCVQCCMRDVLCVLYVVLHSLLTFDATFLG